MSSTGDVGVIGMCVDGQYPSRDIVEEICHQASIRICAWARSSCQQAHLPLKIPEVLEALVDAREPDVGHVVERLQLLEHGQSHLL